MTNIKIYTKPNCSYCVRAKQLLNSKAIMFEEIAITGENRDLILESFPTAQTAPIITINGKYIGGYDQLVPLVEDLQSELLLG